MSSTLETTDLLEVAGRIQHDRPFTDRLGRLIAESAYLVESVRRAPARSAPAELQTFASSADELLRLFEKKRMPKRGALGTLRAVSRGADWKPRLEATLRQNIVELLENFDKVEQRERLITETAKILGMSEDPFLRELAR
jgi:hypothetical protein